MKEINRQRYEGQFEKIYQWLHNNVHQASDSYQYHTSVVPGDYLRLVELIDSRTDNVHFRVLVKATDDALNDQYRPSTSGSEVMMLMNTETGSRITYAAAYQCIIIKIDESNEPVEDMLLTYQPHLKQWFHIK